MSEDNKRIVRSLYQAAGEGDFGTFEELIADDVVEHEELPGFEPTKRGVIEFFRHLKAAFPDLQMNPDDMIAEGDKVFIRATMAGTHRGEFMGIPATGRQIAVPVGDFLRLDGGKIAEHWGITDTETMMRQLGVLED